MANYSELIHSALLPWLTRNAGWFLDHECTKDFGKSCLNILPASCIVSSPKRRQYCPKSSVSRRVNIPWTHFPSAHENLILSYMPHTYFNLELSRPSSFLIISFNIQRIHARLDVFVRYFIRCCDSREKRKHSKRTHKNRKIPDDRKLACFWNLYIHYYVLLHRTVKNITYKWKNSCFTMPKEPRIFVVNCIYFMDRNCILGPTHS